ncbi:MAG TPA: peptidoglycan-binding protein LysM [Chitinophagales bacterium]|nr:peptidoglycan-binding protein LysM [Chitinophagales bacterium]MCB9075327.1 peptidoglycan-binding protein LysM [Chitinophagales bacterium]HMU97226.1 peptidoglycan-binding protein LysM [Chitinophagales bacterium]HMV02029.1 peptidoglycan-binding protein LysM [Chitinophagales bacterium]HMW93743.1 peptidoglycan-binding protein LysM [Chitinophagales bacterium]
MGLFNFIKTAGQKVFGKKPEETQTEEEKQLQAKELLAYVQSLGLEISNLTVIVSGQKVTVRGEVASQEIREKILLALGNVEGVAEVDDTISVIVPAPEAKLHTVVSGDTLSKIAKTYYGNANDYNRIFEANKPMLSHPDKIYVGQVLRIPQA